MDNTKNCGRNAKKIIQKCFHLSISYFWIRYSGFFDDEVPCSSLQGLGGTIFFRKFECEPVLESRKSTQKSEHNLRYMFLAQFSARHQNVELFPYYRTLSNHTKTKNLAITAIVEKISKI